MNEVSTSSYRSATRVDRAVMCLFTFDKMLHHLEERNANVVYEIQERRGSSPKGSSNHGDRALIIGDRIFLDEPIVHVSTECLNTILSGKAQEMISKLFSLSYLHRGQCIENCVRGGSALALTQS